jgi:hypothetical protein
VASVVAWLAGRSATEVDLAESKAAA